MAVGIRVFWVISSIGILIVYKTYKLTTFVYFKRICPQSFVG